MPGQIICSGIFALFSGFFDYPPAAYACLSPHRICYGQPENGEKATEKGMEQTDETAG